MRNGTKFGTHACSHSIVISHNGFKSNLMKYSYFYLEIHKPRRQLGGGGVKNWTKLPPWERGFQKSGKITDIVYGWSLTPLGFQFSPDTFLSCYPLSVQGELKYPKQRFLLYLSLSKVYWSILTIWLIWGTHGTSLTFWDFSQCCSNCFNLRMLL